MIEILGLVVTLYILAGVCGGVVWVIGNVAAWLGRER